MYPICHSEKRFYIYVYTYIYLQFIPQPGSTGWAWLDVLRALCATKGLDVERESTTHFPPRSCVTVPKDRPLFPTRLRNFHAILLVETSSKSLVTRATFRFKGRIFKRVFLSGTKQRSKLCFPLSSPRDRDFTALLQRTREGKWRATCIRSSGGKKFLRGDILSWICWSKKNQLVSKSLSFSSSISKHQRSRLARLDGPITGDGVVMLYSQDEASTNRTIN